MTARPVRAAMYHRGMTDGLLKFFDACPALLFVAEPDGTLRHRSRALDKQFGHCFAGGASLQALVEADEQPMIAAFLRELGTPGASATCMLHAPHADGTLRSLRCLARADDGTISGCLEFAVTATPEAESTQRIEHALLHAITNSIELVLWAVEPNGKFVFHDGKGLAKAGLTRGQWLGQNVFDLYPPDACESIHAAFAGTLGHSRSEAHGVHWESWNIPVRNRAGEVEYCAGVTLDVSDRVANERNLERQLETITEQQRSIHELSAPIINVWDRVLTVPLIGVMDRTRTDELTSRLLAEVHRVRARFAILDLTGVETIDTAIADHLLRLLGSLRLLGVEGLITGVSPQVAQTMVGVGIDFKSVTTLRTVREGLRYCMRALQS